MKRTILITSEDIDQAAKDFLVEKGYHLRLVEDDSVDTICKNVGDCCGIIARDGQFTKEVFDAAPNLKVLARHGVGLEIIDIPEATAHAVQVCNTPTANSNSVAEHTIMLLLACARNLSAVDHGLRTGNWNIRDAFPFQEVSGKTLGIVGFGRIGQLVAQKAALGFGMNVLFYEPYAAVNQCPDYTHEEKNLDTLIRSVDFLTVHVPLTDETKGLINKERLQLMKDGSVLVNAARGGIVDEEDLQWALREGKLSSAGLDVFVEEPFENGKASPLFELENLIITPHIAAKTHEAMGRMAMEAAMDVDRVLNGQEPVWPVNHLT